MGRAVRKLRWLLTPRALARRLVEEARARTLRLRTRGLDALRPTWAAGAPGPLARLLPDPASVAGVEALAGPLGALVPRWLDGRVDLLGSGWVETRHGAACAGLDGHGYPAGGAVPDPEGRWLASALPAPCVAEARRRWRLVSPGHVAIDWQRDLRSGFRWSERTWFRDVAYGRLPGVDVKLPWELGRLQRLPRLAVAHALARAGHAGLGPPERLARAVIDELVDFAAQNPPRWGVQWTCTMDVAIRATNLLVAVDLLRAGGAALQPAALDVAARSALEHGRHIAAHLEWDPRCRANHYLADLAGLLACALWLPPTAETDGWLAFAAHELQAEALLQFGPDGACFEASTSYHRLSGEMLAWGAALLLAAPPERLARAGARVATPPGPPPRRPATLLFPTGPGGAPTGLRPELLALLPRLAAFSRGVTKPDGRVVQLGDNDAGRFVSLEPVLGADGREELLDHRPFAATLEGLLGAPVAGPGAFEGRLLRALAGPRAPAPVAAPPPGPLVSWPDFGLHVWRRPRLWLSVRCGPVGQRGNGGHAHNDALSFALCLDGQDVVIDPGTGVYTPLPALRDRLRATAAHATLVVDGLEQNPFAGPFSLEERARPRALLVEGDRFTGEHGGFGAPHRRTLEVGAAGLTGLDACAAPGRKRLRFPLAPGARVEPIEDGLRVLLAGGGRVRLRGAGAWSVTDGLWSASYGRWEPSPVAELALAGDEARWSIALD